MTIDQRLHAAARKASLLALEASRLHRKRGNQESAEALARHAVALWPDVALLKS